MDKPNTIRERIDNGPFNPAMMAIVAIAFMLNLIDGFDVIAMSVAATSLASDWGISRGQLGPIFSAALTGMAIGAALLAPIADRKGRRRALLISSLTIGTAMIVTGFIPGGLPDLKIGPWAMSQSIWLLILIRFIAGLGVGVILANGPAIVSESVPEKHRNFGVLLAMMGYTFGAMLVGPIANAIISAQGWEQVFIFGGIASLVMGLVIILFLPESVDFLASKENRSDKDLAEINKILARFKRDPIDAFPERANTETIEAAKVSSILTPEFRRDTFALWTIYFVGFLCLYFLLTWIPTLFVDAGYSRKQGVQALTYQNAGGVIGILIVGFWAKKAKLAKPIGLFFFAAAMPLVLISVLKLTQASALNVMIFINGIFLHVGFVGLYALATAYYPTRVRATGVGWGAGLGRVGAIVAPLIAGVLAASGWNMYSLFLLFAIPLLVGPLLIMRFKL